MKIYNLASPFLNQYEPSKEYYESYFNHHPEIFSYYFENHCHNKELKLENALKAHPNKIEQMNWITDKLKSLTPHITKEYEKRFPIIFSKDVYIFVGLGGSNAYTYRSMDPHIAFCVEKFEPYEEGLNVIIAHEFGHAVHHLYTTHNGIEAKDIQWSNPLTWLLQEGVATFLSTLVVNVDQDIYFAYKRDPEWLSFCKKNIATIINAFQKDLIQSTSAEIFKEWFSINGGQTFGYSRIGYFIAYLLVKRLAGEKGIENAMLYWGHTDFEERMKTLLQIIVKKEK
ncbi:hypothetical protein B857_00721 [Solibacillus isronensis B3W22]|uniref:DUF2268 domain-containing protein n=1 Tax=Solibacillus isronensis B3W22 TaxID=1224748 RepID=K1KVD8_9BACL|nr:hypothetical protein [Solibacillus isronensis]AMO85852.1 hypothetical protein SOLI23_09700 [Solibacillus silvestris]EKB46511.1 hypothetical protein B857_00721 [Solibacillus isronensis B3W22]